MGPAEGGGEGVVEDCGEGGAGGGAEDDGSGWERGDESAEPFCLALRNRRGSGVGIEGLGDLGRERGLGKGVSSEGGGDGELACQLW